MTVDVNDLTTRLAEFRALIGAGTEVVLTDDGRPFAKVVPTPANGSARPARVFDMHPGAFDPAPDFDAPLPDEFWLGDDA